MDENLLNQIQSGKAGYKIDNQFLLGSILGHVTRNQHYLAHIIAELYPKEKERTAVFAKLDAEADKYAYEVLTKIIDFSERLSG